MNFQSPSAQGTDQPAAPTEAPPQPNASPARLIQQHEDQSLPTTNPPLQNIVPPHLHTYNEHHGRVLFSKTSEFCSFLSQFFIRAYDWSKGRYLRFMEDVDIDTTPVERFFAKLDHFYQRWPYVATVLIITLLFIIGFCFVIMGKGYEAALPETNPMVKLSNRWDASGFRSDFKEPSPSVLNVDLKPISYRHQLQKNTSQNRNPYNFIKERTTEKNDTKMSILDKYQALDKYEVQQEPKKDDTSETGLQGFKLQKRHQNTFLGQALKKYSFYERHIQKIQKQIMEANLEAIRQAQQFDKQNLQFRYDNKGKLVEWDNTRHRLGLNLLTLFPLLDLRQTSPYWFNTYWELFMRSCCAFMIEDRFGWNYLQDMLEGEGHWISSGSRLTLGSLTDSGFDYRLSDFNLFVPSIIRFVFPSNIPDDTQFVIYGIRMRYDLYRKKESYVFREKLGKFKIVKTEFEKQNNMAIRRDFYCESLRCHQAVSLVKIYSTEPLRICGISIQSVYAYDWKEGKI